MAQLSMKKFALIAFALALAAEGASTAKMATDAALRGHDAPRLVSRTGSGSGNQGGNTDYQGGKGSNQGENGPTKSGGQSFPRPSGRPHSKRSKNRDNNVDSNPMLIAKSVCPDNLFGCPIAEGGSLSSLPSDIATWFTEGFECFDLENDLRACGGCASMNKVHDCTSIPGADSVTCEAGKCIVQTCAKGFTLDEDDNNCVASQSQ
ncbi:hypothetical protein FA13DRAFT_1724675 [Coprinellus micaceus]|uniref:Protein CPL1-like domain-containing protein n=1 Tax=Coprinellus micaceus TaxID=71717 RepID=A0A4Y7TY37_COPMI|nr:hypothetical protein FA13DRAFT_1724675 [Coprinellus micaceus]